MDDLIKLDTEQRGDLVIAHVSGELDVSGASGLGDQIFDSVPTSVHALIVDFSGLEFIDSSGIAMLFGLARKVAARRQEMRVVAKSGEPVARVLDLVDFDRAAAIHDDLDSAIADIASA
jgi:anti-anti-sigma factor